MRIFDIYQHPRWGTSAIQRGFSWPAFVAPSVWAAAKGLGTLTLLLVVCSTLMFDLLKIATEFNPGPQVMLAMFIAAYLVFGLRPGICGNQWHARKLQKDGYSLKITVAADDRRQALNALMADGSRPGPVLVLCYGTADWPSNQADTL
jgi:hypothetical protein